MRHVVTVRVSYWSEACQPKHHSIKALTDTADQVLARQATLTVHVDVLRHMRVASVLSQPASKPGKPVSSGTPAEDQGLGDLNVTVQVVRHGTERALLVCFLVVCKYHLCDGPIMIVFCMVISCTVRLQSRPLVYGSHVRFWVCGVEDWRRHLGRRCLRLVRARQIFYCGINVPSLRN